MSGTVVPIKAVVFCFENPWSGGSTAQRDGDGRMQCGGMNAEVTA